MISSMNSPPSQLPEASSSLSRFKSILLSNLPLRPSTLSILTRHGFITAFDVLEIGSSSSSQSLTSGGVISHGNGTTISSLATELNVSLSVAASIFREIQTLVSNNPTTASHTGTDLSETQNHNSIWKPPMIQTAASILQQMLPPPPSSSSSSFTSPPLRPIVSFVQSIDSMLGGGFFPREVTEIVGTPGSGKTQIAIQLCVDARLPPQFGGVAGGALYLDTEGSFSPERCYDMAHALLQHVHASAKKSQTKAMATTTATTAIDQEDTTTTTTTSHAYKKKRICPPTTTIKTVPSSFTVEAILDGIHVFPIHDEEALVATIMNLSHLVETFQKEKGFPIKLVVVDSIAFHFRSISSDSKTRTRSILSLVHSLADLANKYNIAIVLINQMTTQVSTTVSNHNNTISSTTSTGIQYPQQDLMDGQENKNTSWMVQEGNTKMIPALGASFAHSTTTRLLLMQDSIEYILKDTSHHQQQQQQGKENDQSYMEGTTTTAVVGGRGRGIPIPKRICKLIKSPHKPTAIAHFCVMDCGVRDWPTKVLW